MDKKIRYGISILAMMVLPVLAQADYVGPEEILSLEWGKGDNQMGIATFARGDHCSLPYDEPLFSVDAGGAITLIDFCNQKIKYFRNRSLQRIAQSDRKTLEEIMTVPMEMGKEVKWEQVGEFGGKATVAFGDKTVTLNRRGAYYRDPKEYLYSIRRHSEVHKFDPSGKGLGGLSIRYQSFADNEDNAGGPILDSEGNVYFWKWYPDRFRILKWTWREAQELYGLPDAPRYVEADPSKNGIGVRWWFPFQERDTITGFEVLRSEKSGTPPYRSLGIISRKDITGFTFFEDTTAEKGVTYYYRMRTISGDRYSLYSNEAICKR